MRRILLFISGLVLVLAVAACGGSRNVPSGAVAVVGSKSISKSAYDALVTQTKRNYAATKHQFPKPGTVALANLRAIFVQFLIQANEYQQEADKRGIKVTEKDVSDRLAQIKKQYYGNPAGQPAATTQQMDQRYQQALKQQGFTDAEVRAGLKIQLFREKVQQDVVKDVKVSDSEIKTYYDAHKQTYEQPAKGESREVRHILVKTKAKADQLYAEVKAKPSRFAALANKWSIDPGSKAYGGLLPGGAVKGHLLKPFEKVAFSLKVNEISKPVHTSAGWHIIQALGPVKPATPAKALPLSQVKDSIRAVLLDTKKRAAITKWENDFKNSYCKKISYQAGYTPPPGQDPCKTKATTTTSTTG
jgi:foldase protein PrsA